MTVSIAVAAVANPPRHGVTADNFRIICSCQQHGGRGVWSSRVPGAIASLRTRARILTRALALAAPLALCAAHIPFDSLLLLASAQPSSAAELPAATSRVRPAENQFRVITPSVRTQFLAAADDPRSILETAREEFFRNEIPYGRTIYREAKRNGFTPEFVAAVVGAESDFRPRLISHKNAHGLMQIIPSTGRLMGARDLLDPADNVRVGTKYLRYLHRRFRGDRTLILAAYNAGEGTVTRFGGVPPFRETTTYLRRVAVREREYSRRVNEYAAKLRDCRIPEQPGILTASMSVATGASSAAP